MTTEKADADVTENLISFMRDVGMALESMNERLFKVEKVLIEKAWQEEEVIEDDGGSAEVDD